MRNIELFQIDAFTKKPFQGNSAAVTFADELTSKEMQLIAREMNLAETAFLSGSDKADFNLRWFTPTVEVQICGHATIASLHFLKEHNLLNDGTPVTFDTLSGQLKCRREEDNYFMQIPLFKMKEFNENNDEIIKVLGITENDLDPSIPFILLENKYLYIYLKTLKSLGRLSPDFKMLKFLTESKKEFEAVAAFTLETFEKNSFAHSRFFAPYYGIDEDPVTGSMNGPLLLVLKRLGFIANNEKEINLIFEQGDFIGRNGRVGVCFNEERNELYISGNAVTVLKGALSF